MLEAIVVSRQLVSKAIVAADPPRWRHTELLSEIDLGGIEITFSCVWVSLCILDCLCVCARVCACVCLWVVVDAQGARVLFVEIQPTQAFHTHGISSLPPQTVE